MAGAAVLPVCGVRAADRPPSPFPGAASQPRETPMMRGHTGPAQTVTDRAQRRGPGEMGRRRCSPQRTVEGIRKEPRAG